MKYIRTRAVSNGVQYVEQARLKGSLHQFFSLLWYFVRYDGKTHRLKLVQHLVTRLTFHVRYRKRAILHRNIQFFE